MDTAANPIQSDQCPVYLVIGAAGGVGSDLARRLIRRETKVILAGRDEGKISTLAESLNSKYFVCDATNFKDMQDCIEFARSIHGRLDGVANCVGSILLKPAHLTTEEEWQSVIATNLSAAFATVKYAAKAMMGNGGSIVLVSSCAAKVGLPNHEAIAAAKSGVEGLVRSAAATYARQQIRVNCVAPGLLNTKMSQPIISNDARLQASIDMHALGRIGTATDISSVLDWLLSEQSNWVTGQTISIDGGLSSLRPMARRN
jgi:NAD(P)-dependent dehydrogenase (short-subunit alcohol dehydrogenase family)